MEPKFYLFPLIAIVPMIIGAIYYNPAVMGTAWMKASGISKEQAQSGNMLKIFGFAYVFSLMSTMILYSLVVHQASVSSLLSFVEGFGEAGTEVQVVYEDFMNKYGTLHRTFGHGALHGVFSTLFFVWPIIGIVALFERKGWQYTGIHTLYWVISLGLMGGLLCQFA